MSSVIPSVISGQESFKQDLATLLRLSVEEIKALAQTMESLTDLSDIKGIGQELAAEVMPIITYLYCQARDGNISSQDLVGEIITIGKEMGVTVADEQAEGLRTLFDPKTLLDERHAIAVAKGNVLPTVTRTFLGNDLRSVNDARTGKYLGVIPVTTLNLRLQYPDGHTDSVSVELSEEALTVLLNGIETAIKDLGEFKKQARSGMRVLEE